MGDIDVYDPPVRTFWPSYFNILIHLQSTPENHDENKTVASWVWHHPLCTSRLEAIWAFFYADVGQTDRIHLSLRTTGYGGLPPWPDTGLWPQVVLISQCELSHPDVGNKLNYPSASARHLHHHRLQLHPSDLSAIMFKLSSIKSKTAPAGPAPTPSVSGLPWRANSLD